MEENVKIFMCTHKPYSFLPPLGIAVQGGSKNKPSVPGTIPDYGQAGSISEKNSEYCELTVQYYAWKNEYADYYGFCHYRRFFCFNKNVKKPYLTLGRLSQKNKKRLFLNEEDTRSIITAYDVVIPRAEDLGISVYEKYAMSKYCYADDLDVFIDVLKKSYPYLSEFADEYLNQNKQYFCNMFIMQREHFFEYCEHLFSLLEQFDKVKRIHGDFQSDRTDGYIAERFLGIYILYLKSKGLKIYECSRIDIECSVVKRMINLLLPPESNQRILIKRLKLNLINKRKRNSL